MLIRSEQQLKQDPKGAAVKNYTWISWSHESAYVPEEIHKSHEAVGRLLKWLEKDPGTDSGPGAVQLYCLAMGMTMADILLAQTGSDEDGVFPADVPEYFSDTAFTFSDFAKLEKVCDRAFPSPGPRRIQPTRKATGAELAEPSGTSDNAPTTQMTEGASLSVTKKSKPAPRPLVKTGKSETQKQSHREHSTGHPEPRGPMSVEPQSGVQQSGEPAAPQSAEPETGQQESAETTAPQAPRRSARRQQTVPSGRHDSDIEMDGTSKPSPPKKLSKRKRTQSDVQDQAQAAHPPPTTSEAPATRVTRRSARTEQAEAEHEQHAAVPARQTKRGRGRGRK